MPGVLSGHGSMGIHLEPGQHGGRVEPLDDVVLSDAAHPVLGQVVGGARSQGCVPALVPADQAQGQIVCGAAACRPQLSHVPADARAWAWAGFEGRRL